MAEIMIPLFDRVLLRRQVAKQVGSILLPVESQKMRASLRCEVVLLGPDCELRKNDGLKPGDHVLISRYGGDWLNKDGRPITEAEEAEFYVVKEQDIICVFKSTDEVESERGSTGIDRAIDAENRKLRAV